MNKYDKYVYLTICEISLDCFKKSKFISYTNTEIFGKFKVR
jgi:hypothetical protein